MEKHSLGQWKVPGLNPCPFPLHGSSLHACFPRGPVELAQFDKVPVKAKGLESQVLGRDTNCGSDSTTQESGMAHWGQAYVPA